MGGAMRLEGLKSCAAASGRGVRTVPAAEHPGQTAQGAQQRERLAAAPPQRRDPGDPDRAAVPGGDVQHKAGVFAAAKGDRKSTRLNSSHVSISYAVFCLKKKKDKEQSESELQRHSTVRDRKESV